MFPSCVPAASQLAAANFWAEMDDAASPYRPYLDALPTPEEMVCPLVQLPQEYYPLLASAYGVSVDHSARRLCKQPGVRDPAPQHACVCGCALCVCVCAGGVCDDVSPAGHGVLGDVWGGHGQTGAQHHPRQVQVCPRPGKRLGWAWAPGRQAVHYRQACWSPRSRELSAGHACAGICQSSRGCCSHSATNTHTHQLSTHPCDSCRQLGVCRLLCLLLLLCWVQLSTRLFGLTVGASMVPLLDLANHVSTAGCDSDLNCLL